MTNAAAVTQAPVAPGEAIADRSRSADRQSRAEGDDGGFSGLLSKLEGGDRGKARGDAEQTAEGPPATGDRCKLPGWLNGNAEAFAEEAPAEAGEDLVLDESSGAQTADDAQSLMLAAVAQGGANAAGDGAMLNGAAVVAVRAADGKAGGLVEPQPRHAEDGVELLSPQTLPDLAEPPRDVSRRLAQAAPDGTRPTVAELTVLRRETHLAPAREAAFVEAGMNLAAEVGNGNPRTTPTGAQRASLAADGDVLRPAGALGRGAAAQPLAPHLAVTAARNPAEAALAGPGLQAANDALLMGADPQGGIEQAAPIVRADAPPGTGPATGILQQLVDRITGEAGTSPAPATTAQRAEALTFVQRSPFLSSAKVLYIQLQPAELGTVTVRMSLRDQALQLDLEVRRGETADLIQRERETLSTLLRSVGYLVDGLDVRVADQGAFGASAGGGQQSMQMPAGSQQGSSGADARSPGARPQDERRGNPFGNERNRDDEQAGHAPRRGGIYV